MKHFIIEETKQINGVIVEVLVSIQGILRHKKLIDLVINDIYFKKAKYCTVSPDGVEAEVFVYICPHKQNHYHLSTKPDSKLTNNLDNLPQYDIFKLTR